MKQGTVELLKFRKLVRRLGDSTRGVVGLLELLWAATAKQAPCGDIGRHSNEDIAELCDWDGEADALIEALVACGWLDVDETYRLVVHDWHDHAPGWVRAALMKRKQSFVTARSSEASNERSNERSSEHSLEASSERSTRARAFPSQAKPSQAKPSVAALTSDPFSEGSFLEEPEPHVSPKRISGTSRHIGDEGASDSRLAMDYEFPQAMRTDEFRSAWHQWIQYVLERDGRLKMATVGAWAMEAARLGPEVAAARLNASVSGLARWGPLWQETAGSRANPRKRDRSQLEATINRVLGGLGQ